MIDKNDLQKLGVMSKPHGVEGEFSLRMESHLAGYHPDPEYLFLEINGGLVPFEVASFRLKSETNLLVILDTVASEEKARILQGADVYIIPEELGKAPEREGVQLSNLIGFEVTDKAHGVLGAIKSVVDIQNNPLLEIDYHGRELLIPMNEDFIVSLDVKKRKLVIAAPAGLIDLYLE